MKYYWKLFLWENGEKSTEYSKYLMAPVFLEDKLDETLDSGEVILKGMPISTRAAFPPKTKFRIERYTSRTDTTPQKKWDMIVEHDDVEEFVGCPSICTHRIYLIEASAVAQNMHVDNIALTYELQDVTLDYRTISEDTTIIGSSCDDQDGGYGYGYRETGDTTLISSQMYTTAYFRNSYRYIWDDITGIQSLLRNLSAEQAHTITFDVPRLICQGATDTGSWSNVAVDLFEMNTVTRVYEVLMLNGAEQSREVIAEKYSGATSFTEADDDRYYSDGSTAALRKIDDNNEPVYNNITSNFWSRSATTYPVVATADEDYGDKTVTFTTKVLTAAEVDAGYYYVYEIECYATPTNADGMVAYLGKICVGTYYGIGQYGYNVTTESEELEEEENVYLKASFTCGDLSNIVDGGYFLMSAVKYSAYDLFQKALLTVDTQIIEGAEDGTNSTGIDDLADSYPIVLSSDWEDKLKSTTTYETTFEEKNLWEVLLQIGYYLHAVPYLEFAEDGTDRFVLNFRQLGDTKEKSDTNTKITVFNSRNLSEFFTQYDSYVTNLFSPQNEVDEWLVAKTSDSTYLVSNDTAELQTSRPILEIVEFDITYDGSAGGNARTESALDYIFEESVYSVLTSDNPITIKPAKGNALYYSLGDNIIQGLNYVPPSVNDGEYYYALQEICRRLFAITNPEELKFNSLLFHIKYKTQDELRFTQVRPDIQNFMKNSAYEKYPHHEQFYGQQDKIVDSERFSYNLFGRLIRVGNAVYQRQEYAELGGEKEAGDLVIIHGEPYYVTEVENEFYPSIILQKVTYSKNFNELSNIVTIPSEPRFYEVSERSKVRREVRLMDFLELSSTPPETAASTRFLSNSRWKDFIKGLLFNKEEHTLPNFAYTKFMADYTREHKNSADITLEPSELFPSSDIDRSNPNNIKPQSSSDHSACIVSLLYYPLHDAILFEWDMADNFSAGDYVDPDVTGINTEEDAYYAQQSHRYVDVMGRADFFTFRLFHKDDWTTEEAQQLPKAVYTPAESECDIFLPSPSGIALDKDNREAISVDYQINLLHRPTDSDKEDFFTFSNLFGTKDSPLKMALLSEPQSLFNNTVSATDIVADDVEYELVDDDELNAIEVQISAPSGVDLSAVQSIVLYQVDEAGGRYVYISKNVTQKEGEDKLSSWWIFPVYSD